MIKKIILLIITVLLVASSAWALTSHKDYATLEIKDCNSCHQSSGVTQNHGSMWIKDHRLYKEKLPNNCADCHQQSFCLDCHTGGGIDRDLHASTSGADYMPKSHRTDFREIHPIKAADDPKSCYRCHDARRFCNECHSKVNVNELMPESHRKQFSDIKLSAIGPKHAIFNVNDCQTCHKKGALPTSMWSAGHAREARKNLATCQTCHPEGDVCMKCHSAKTGLMVNPHPRSWDRMKGRLERAGNNRTCVKCH